MLRVHRAHSPQAGTLRQATLFSAHEEYAGEQEEEEEEENTRGQPQHRHGRQRCAPTAVAFLLRLTLYCNRYNTVTEYLFAIHAELSPTWPENTRASISTPYRVQGIHTYDTAVVAATAAVAEAWPRSKNKQHDLMCSPHSLVLLLSTACR